MKNGFYMYGCIRANQAQEFGVTGIGASPVKTILVRDVAAVVSESPFTIYDSLEKEKTIKDLVTHQFVIEHVMQQWTIVPIKFGTMVESEERVRAFLEEGYELISSELSKMKGKIELDVVARLNLSRVLAALPRIHAQVREKQHAVFLKGAHASNDEKIALGQLIEHVLEEEKDRYQQNIMQTLSQKALAVRQHAPADEEMVFNAAFLLERQNEEAFTSAIEMLDRDFANTLNFRVVGPLPVYSFSTLVLESIDADEFEQARKMFGLEGEITEKTVRDAYHRLAQQAHPDANGGKVTDFHLVHAAYQTLKSYVEKGPVHVGLHRWEDETA